jgi:DNA-binding XRE family transcriptional regulator
VGWGHVSLLRNDSPYDIGKITRRQWGIVTLRATATPEGEIFGAHLRELRTARGLTQAELADLARTSKPFISNLERGLTTPTLGMLLRLADALDQRPSNIIRVFDRAPRLSPKSRKP